ncbi:hypothetical protein L484_009163 [Morus notabilis]|uniref:Uncharacterized protein n=1 Tax=Morus notabilis TaxID=981085 RepID=W9R9N0_9ROSA|nr:hypothetical protein L484_009163 [Morus notabilis]
MSKSDPKLQVLALFLANRPLLALEFFPTGRPVTLPSVDRPPLYRQTDTNPKKTNSFRTSNHEQHADTNLTKLETRLKSGVRLQLI